MTTAVSDMSLEHQVALMSPEEQQAILSELDMDELAWDWNWNARPSQKIPILPSQENSTVPVRLILAGRGFGKTLTGAQWIRALDTNWKSLQRDTTYMRFCLLGRTSGDVRDVMIEGPSGIKSVYPPSLQDKIVWTPSRRRLELPGGAVGITFSAEEPDQLRGPAFHIGWADELAAYKQVRGTSPDEPTAWDNLRIAVRLGQHPQVLATTTPKRVPVIRALMKEAADSEDILVTRGKTRDNRKLSAGYLGVLNSLYGGTKLGRQELEGEVLDDIAGAMTTESIINDTRMAYLPQNIPWIRLIGVDPSVAEKPHDECGIVVVYISNTWPILKRHAFVIDDLSGRMTPAQWGDVVVKAAHEHQATVVVETNQGGNVVTQMLRQSATAAGVTVPPIRESWSSKAKAVRAEPVSGAYARRRVHHINVLSELETQLTSWVPGESGYSPDRMDALVHAVAGGMFPEALINGIPGTAAIHSAARRQLPIGTASTFGRR